MKGRTGVGALLALSVAAAFLAIASHARAGGGLGGGYTGYGPMAREASMFARCGHIRRPARVRACLIRQALGLVRSYPPATELPRIDRYAHDTGGTLFVSCHIIMHTVGRRYGRITHLTLARLNRYLPRSNDPGCSAGFAHGLLTYLGPQIVKMGPRGAVRDCNKAPTRYQRYSCIHGLGHAYMRLFGETFSYALHWCRALGTRYAVDCAQGAYHDYWMSLNGYDNTHRPPHAKTSPRAVCGAQPRAFVRACWYRAYLERPLRRPPHSTNGLLIVCRGLHGRQLGGCITATAVVASEDPFHQLRICAALPGRLPLDCVRGVRVWGLAGTPYWYQVKLVRGCSAFRAQVRMGCYAWLGKTMNVIRNGNFTRRGCSRLVSARSRTACDDGARAYAGPLGTFS